MIAAGDGESIGQDVLPYVAMAWASGYVAAKGQAADLALMHAEELHAILAEHAAGRAQAVTLLTPAASVRDATLIALGEAQAAASRIAVAIGAMAPGSVA